MENQEKKNFIYGKSEMQIIKDNYFLNEIEDKQYEHEEFIDILKSVGLSLEKYEELTKVKFFSEFTEIIEMLLNLIKEKEKIITILQRENDNLNANNFNLNKDNMFLFNQNINLKKELSLINNNNNINNVKNSLTFIKKLNKLNGNQINQKIKDSMHNYKEYLNINQKESKLPTDHIFNIQRVIIESSIDMESSTLREKYEKEKEKIKKENKSEETSLSNGISLKNKDNKSNAIKETELFVKPILEKNVENNNLENNINIQEIENNNNATKKIDSNLYKRNINNKYIGTLISVTSSEFRDGCPGVDSFLSTMKFNETKKN